MRQVKDIILKSDNDRGFVLLSALTMVLFMLSLAVLFAYAAVFYQNEEAANCITEKRVLQYKRALMGRFADYEGKPGGKDNNYAVGGYFDDVGSGHDCPWHSLGGLSATQTGYLLAGPSKSWGSWGPYCRGDISWNYNDRQVTCDCFSGHTLKEHDAFSGWRGPYIVIPPGEGRPFISYEGIEFPCFCTGWKSMIQINSFGCMNECKIHAGNQWAKETGAFKLNCYGAGIYQGYYFIVKIINWPAEFPCENIVARYICPRFGYAFEELTTLEGCQGSYRPDGVPLFQDMDGTVKWEDGIGYVYIAQPGWMGGLIMGFDRLRLYYDDDPDDPDNSLVMLMEQPMAVPWKPAGWGGDIPDTEYETRRLSQNIWIDCKR